MVRADAVRLFLDRAQAVKDDFVLTNTNAPAVIRVCERLDGVPLAIELAAARITAMNPAELVRRLDRRFELLAGGRRKAVERHQTLRAAIDWSYELLSEPEQQLLARLAVFAGAAPWRRRKRSARVIRSWSTTCSSCSRVWWQLARRCRLHRCRHSLPVVGNDPPVRRRTPRPHRRHRAAAAPPRRVLHGIRTRRAHSNLRAGTDRVGGTTGP